MLFRSSWEAAYAHHGELRALSSSGNNKKMKVSLSREELTVQTYPLRGADVSGRAEKGKSANSRSQSWSAGSSESRPSLMEFVEEVSQDRP